MLEFKKSLRNLESSTTADALNWGQNNACVISCNSCNEKKYFGRAVSRRS